MRILFFSHYFPPEGNAPASRVYEMCRRWVKDGHAVDVITCAPNVPNGEVYDGYKNRVVQKETIDGIRTIRVWTFITANKGTFKRIINYVTYMLSAVPAGLFVKKPDIIIATSPQLFCGWAGVIVGKIRARPVILEVRDIWPDAIRVHEVLTGRFINAFLEFIARKLYTLAVHIVAAGDGYKQVLVQDKAVSAADISVITNGADLDTYFPVEINKDLKLKYAQNGRFICSYIGTIGMSHGLEVVIRAAKLLKQARREDITFLFVGDGAVREEIEGLARREKLDNVIFAGRQDKKMMPDFYSISDVCLVHVRNRQVYKTVLPSKIFEIWAMGKPLILGVEGGAAQMVKNAQGGICIQPENEVQLAEAVEKLADNPALAAEFGRKGADYVRRHFDRDIISRNYMDILKRVIEVSPRGRKPIGACIFAESGRSNRKILNGKSESTLQANQPGRLD